MAGHFKKWRKMRKARQKKNDSLTDEEHATQLAKQASGIICLQGGRGIVFVTSGSHHSMVIESAEEDIAECIAVLITRFPTAFNRAAPSIAREMFSQRGQYGTDQNQGS